MIDIRGKLPKHKTKRYRVRRERVRGIVIHHSAGSARKPLVKMAKYFVSRWGRNWPGFAYHYVLDANGQLYYTQDRDLASYHTRHANEWTVGLLVQGNFARGRTPTLEQIDRLGDAVSEIALQNGVDDDAVYTHSDFTKPACPGSWLEGWVKGWKDSWVGPWG